MASAVSAELARLCTVAVAARSRERRPASAGVALKHFRGAVGRDPYAEPQLRVAVGEKPRIDLVLV
jgi:hypothetical protein